MLAPRGNQLRLTRSACLNKVIYLSYLSFTSQLESIRFKYLRLKVEITFKELRTCPECKNRYAKHTCIKGPVTRCNFSCNLPRYSTVGRCKIGKTRFHPLSFTISGGSARRQL